MGFVIREEQAMGPGMVWLEAAPSYHTQTTLVLFERSLYGERKSGYILCPSFPHVYL